MLTIILYTQESPSNGMEFTLEDVQQLCAAAFPLHTSSAVGTTWLAMTGRKSTN